MDARSFCRSIAFACVMLVGLTGCGGSDGDDDPAAAGQPVAEQPPVETPPLNSEAFNAVDADARAARDIFGLDDFGIAIYDAAGNKVFEAMYGNFAPDQRVFIASASKLVTGVTIFRLIEEGALSLDSTTAQVLGWTDEKGTITLRQLLSLKSGLASEHLCTYIAEVTLDFCANEIYGSSSFGAPGARFDYGSTHFTVAGRMAEVAIGLAWNAIFTEKLAAPLGLPADIQYYTRPNETEPTANPLLAGGLVMSMNEYATFLQLVMNKGEWQGTQLISPELFDQQAIDPYPDAAGYAGNSAHYGLAAWLECDTPATGCAVISSPGLYGFTPWIDRTTGYYAIIGMENHNLIQNDIPQLLQLRLKPLIEAAMQQLRSQ